MARIRGSSALLEEYGDEVFYDSVHDGVEDLMPSDDDEKFTSKCRVFCECGVDNHIAKKKCDNCGYEKPAKSIDWSLVKSKAPKCPYYTTRCLFKRVCQLHARHGRDVVVLVRHKINNRDMFRFWGTPGSADEFVSGKVGAAVKEAWVDNFRLKSVKRSASDDCPPKKKQKTGKSDIKAICQIINLSDSEQEAEEKDEIYKVETIMDRKNENGKFFYLVKWSGWAPEFNTWEPEENILDRSMLTKFQ